MAEPRGISLERAFADWMKRELGYTRTKLRQPVKGKIADRAYEVDIYAEKYSRLWDFMRWAGLYVFLLAVLTYLLPTEMRELREWMEGVIASFDPTWAGSALAIFGVAGVTLGFLGKNRFITYAWVECKDQRGNVKRAQVQKLAATVQDVRDIRQAKWKPDIVMIVSGTDFDADAYNFAREHKFVCYRRSGTGFERAE